MKTIVALVDFSDVTFKVLKQAHQIAKAFDSHVIILHIVAKEPVVMDFGIVSPTVLREPSPEHISREQAMLEDLRESLTKFGVNATTRQMPESTLDEVLAEIDRLGADLMIMGSHRHGAIYNLLVGSVTESVLKRIKCPVLLVPADDVKE